MHYKIKEVADMAGISVRMLHHYDKIGLLDPESVSDAGYRLYSDENLDRLQQILFFKELNFPLQEIKIILDSPNFNKKEALETHKQLLLEKKIRLEKIIQSVDKTISSMEGEFKMNKKEVLGAFDMTEIEEHQKKYSEEVKNKYGNTSAYKESNEKTSKYTKEDWNNIMKDWDIIYKKLANLMDKNPDDKEVQEYIHQFREHISKNFYDCTPEIFRGLGELYVNDERFTANIDKYKTGLSKFLREAINVYCDNIK
ncbi:MerR family transcriptional regulator [Clostridium botulinum]|uniref:MerR-family transcriptional regulator n=1 Tax=Clostridium botulinum (strain Hall / ATCC 3502 / NCTC 13319 / Type A) TaxID=441771 RepID=A5I0A4_CLOBH|nr:MerR family transcriptional regulator [Clostridium botulinum]ABS33419.1 transcriptional activator TipA [Clostridium botulinum A str. ATCC 19397]ABS36802.1 transcriptional activator TipA [Clostridium botulinum A str. Hall]AWB16830.1 MerR family transcriptional regulator [Clostridium botulinum]EGT5614702.1 MerR family transcriptional regulator [Clostridium botulinum]EGT5621855.1 MerR family transcriptional regulator [Clostridium botulinum]